MRGRSKKLFGSVFFALLILLSPSKSADMADYCSVPPFIGSSVDPNILFVVDASGSMRWCGYNPALIRIYDADTGALERTRVSGCGTYASFCRPSWDPDHCYEYEPIGSYGDNEEGYFIPDKVYRLNSVNNYWEEAPSGTTPQACPATLYDLDLSQAYKGTCLNFLLMTRIDLVRWAITGGRPASCATSSSCNSENPPSSCFSVNRCDPEVWNQPGASVSCDSSGCILRIQNPYIPTWRGGEWEEAVPYVKVPWSRIEDALVFRFKNLSKRPRMGAIFYSGNYVRDHKVYIGDFTSSNSLEENYPYRNLITAINAVFPYRATPTAVALWDALNYFAQNPPEYNGFNPQSGSGDKWKNPIYQCRDQNGDGQCQGSEFEFVPCAKNFVILMTDGQWNRGGPPGSVSGTCTIDTGFEQYSADPVVPAYWMHYKGFVNQPACSNEGYCDTLRVDALYGIGLWLGGTGELSLQHTAIFGSFDISGRTWPGGMSYYPFDSGCNVDDCTVYYGELGKGSVCTALPPSSPDWDKNGDGVPDTFFAAKNATEIKTAIQSAILDILRRASSGSTVATLASRSSVSSIVVQPYFYPSYLRDDGTSVSWLGFIRSFWIDPDQNFREDTVDQKILNVAGSAIDRVFQMFYDQSAKQSRIAFVVDPEGSCSTGGFADLNDAKPVFNAACQLALRNISSDPRKIIINKEGSVVDFTETDTSLVSYLSSIWSGIDPAITDAEAKCVIRYLKGEDVSSDPACSSLRYVQRSREVNIRNFCNLSTDLTKTWRLGDIIHSTPSVVSGEPLATYHLKYNDTTYYEFITQDAYKKRTNYLFVGANDGMLHVFRIGYIKERNQAEKPVQLQNSPSDSGTNKIGVEEWAYIPKNAIPYLLWYGDNSYCHIYTVDYRFLIIDASVSGLPTDTKTKNSWRTLLVGSMGFGGKSLIINDTNGNGVCDPGETNCKKFSSSLFVFDLTDWLNGTATEPKLLWERELPDGSLTTSFPAVIKTRTGDASTDQSDKNGYWYVVVGSGPLDPEGITFPTGSLYFFELEDNDGDGVYGELVNQITLPVPATASVAVGDSLPVDVDRDYFDDVIYFGVYGLSNTKTFGGFYRLPLRTGNTYKDVSTLSSSDISEVVNLSDFATSGNVPPVFAAPDFTKDESQDFWLYFGTGRYLSNDDKRINYDNYFFGVKDKCWDGTCSTTYRRTDLTDATGITVTSTITELGTVCMCDETGCNNELVVTDTTFTEPNEVPKGWYYKLSNEAVISQPIVFGGIVDFLSLTPPASLCDFEGKTKLYALYYKTGTPYPRPSVISPGATTTSGTPTVGSSAQINPSVELGPGVPPFGNPFEVASSTRKKYSKFIQISSGVVIEQTQQVAHEGGFLLWLEK